MFSGGLREPWGVLRVVVIRLIPPTYQAAGDEHAHRQARVHAGGAEQGVEEEAEEGPAGEVEALCMRV